LECRSVFTQWMTVSGQNRTVTLFHYESKSSGFWPA
jgi:hypothetical protein